MNHRNLPRQAGPRLCSQPWGARRFPDSVRIALLLATILPAVALANGVERNGAGARSMALGGSTVASPDEPLEALGANPAGLALGEDSLLQLGGFGAFAEGAFHSPATRSATLSDALGVAPEFALALPLASTPITLGLGFAPDAAAGLDWTFTDPVGGLGGATSYGQQRHFAEFVALRSAAGFGVRLSEQVSVGASVGAVYNRNSLVAPYTFQAHPVLRGFKTLLDLQTEGWGASAVIGMVFRPNPQWSFGLGYHTETGFVTEGDASGNADMQLRDLGGDFSGVRPDFHYDARVNTALPQQIALGASWQFQPDWRIVLEADWIGWNDAFERLDIRLTDGNNADLNGFLGSDRIDDSVPLGWRDRFVIRGGLEFAPTDALRVRVGYAYGADPTRSSTLTPMSAAIFEHTFTAGGEWRWSRYAVAVAYQYDLRARHNVEASALRSGEFSGSGIELAAHSFGLTTSFRF